MQLAKEKKPNGGRGQPPPRLTIIGLMSGTSMDGLDIAACEITDNPFACELRAAQTVPLPAELRARITQAYTGNAATLARLDIALGRFYAEAVGAFCDAHDLRPDAIGSHGQTVYHEHGRTTLQIGEPGFLAQALGCPVISDFRRADIVAGGCGAPLVPTFDIAMFGREHEGVVALNIGGIANLTAIPELALRERALAFDTGPGNMVIDGLVRRMSGGAEALDLDGDLAATGEIDEALLARLLAHPFLAKPPPRSAGREDFGDDFCDKLLAEANPQSAADWQDLIATATMWTAMSITAALRDFVLPEFPVSTLLVGGGGVHNRTLMNQLRHHSNQIHITSMADAGLDPDYREAMAFAYLAARHLHGLPGNLPRATGAAQPAVLGRMTLPLGNAAR